MANVKKKGQHGTLYLFAIDYQDDYDRHNNGTWKCWAYDEEHAAEKFYGSEDAEGWRINAIRKVKETSNKSSGRRNRTGGSEPKVKRAKDFAETHNYEVTIGGHTYLIFRDTDQFSYPNWYVANVTSQVRNGDFEHAGFTKQEAVDHVKSLHAKGRFPNRTYGKRR